MAVPRPATRASSVAALLLVAAVAGAMAAVVGAGFIWLVEEGTSAVWQRLPARLDVDPFASGWIFAVPVVGGVLVGLGQRYLGDHPQSIEHTVALWRSGEALDPRTGPASALNSLAALVSGGPLGFEAALTGVLGATASWVSHHIRSVGRLVREAWGAERVDGLHPHVRSLPYWLSAVAGLVTYRSLPFGQLDLGFRIAPAGPWTDLQDAAVVVLLAAVLAMPLAMAVRVVRRAEGAVWHRRAPELTGMVGGLLFATLALGDPAVLFSGQQGLDHLTELGTASLLYLALAKWAALCLALLAGWRGGPFFPLFLATSALTVAVHDPLGVAPELAMVAGIATVCVVVARGRVPLAFVLALYVVPLAYTGPILVAAVTGAVVLAVSGLGQASEETPGRARPR